MGKQTFRQLVESGGMDKTIYRNWKKQVDNATQYYNSYVDKRESVYNPYSYSIVSGFYDNLIKKGEKIRNLITSGILTDVDIYDVDSVNNMLGQMKNGARQVNDFYKQFDGPDSFYSWSYSNKYKGKSVSEIDEIINALSNGTEPKTDASDRELTWLKNNRDTFMTKDELLIEIGTLEGNSQQLKQDKWLNRFDYAGNLIGGAFSGDTSRMRAYDTAPETAEIENNARLKKLKELLAGKDDFDAESAYKKADEKNLWDVITTDYTYADYLNDKDSKNIYGNAVVRQRDEENFQIISDNSKEFDNDFVTVTNIILNKQTASAMTPDSSLLGGLFSNAYDDNLIMQTDPEIQKIIKKWSDKGYDFESLYNSYQKNANANYNEWLRTNTAEETQNNPVLSNIGSVFTNVAGGIAALPSIVETGIEDLVSDDIVTLDTNAPEWALKNVTDSIRDTTSEMITTNHEGFEGKFYNFLYQTGMSIADMGTATVAGGLNPTAMQIIMGSNAAADSIKTVTENGGSVDEALLTGLASGIFEALFEKVSIDNLFRTATTDTGKKLMYNFVKGFLSEGSEELATDIANTFADALINGNNSDFNNAVYEYMAQGKTAAEARSLAMVDTMKQMGLSFAGGALSGGLVAGVGGGINLMSANSQYSRAGNEIFNNGNVDSVMQLADEIVKNQHNEDVAYDLGAIEKYQKGIENKAFRTSGKADINTAVENRLGEFGVTDSKVANRVTDAFIKGTEYRKTGNATVDKYASRVLSELRSSENATGRENFSNEWASPVVDKARTDAKTAAADKYRARDIGRLAGNVQNAIINSTQENINTEIKKGIQARAEELGVDKSTSKTAADIVFKAFMGDKLTPGQHRILEKNQIVKRVYNELKAADEVGINDDNLWVTPVLENAGILRAVQNVKLSGITGSKENTVTGDGVIDNDSSIENELISTNSDNSSTPTVVNGTEDFDSFVENVRSESMTTGVIKKYSKTGIDNKTAGQIAVLDAYGKKHGLSFIVVDSIGEGDTRANGTYVGKNKVLISLDAEGGALLSVAGHEVYHYIARNNKLGADSIKAFVLSKLKSNDNYHYNERFAELSKQYGTENVDEIEEEMVANAMFELLSDEDVINDLAKENPTLLEKIIAAIKDFIKELKEMAKKLPWAEVAVFQGDIQSLETIKAMAEAALWNIKEINEHKRIVEQKTGASENTKVNKTRENVKTASAENNESEENVKEENNTAIDDGVTKYSKKPTQEQIVDIRTIGRKSVNDFTSGDIKKTEYWARTMYEQIGVKSPFFRVWFGDWRAYDRTPIVVATKKGKNRGPVKNDDTSWNIIVSGKVFDETKVHLSSSVRKAVVFLDYIQDIVKNAVLLDTYVSDKEKENSLFMHSLYAVVNMGNGNEIIKLIVEEMNDPNSEDTNKRAYILRYIKITPTASGRVQNNPSSVTNTANVINTVSDLFSLVKQYDESFKPNPASKIVNEDGTPKVVYHGSYSNFTIFDKNARKHSKSPKGTHFFTDSEAVGYSYTGYKEQAKPGEDSYAGGLYPVYLNIQKPYIIDFKGQLWSEKIDGMDINEHTEYAMNNGYDGAIVNNVIDDGGYGDKNWNEDAPRKKPATDYIVFDSNQIKSATDNIGTFDKDNPDIRFSFAGGKAKTANFTRLDEAIRLESEGLSSEEIRQQTGWFRGYDNKWRFEIDDSKMEFSRKGFFTNPDVLRYHELADKFLYGEISDEENRELQALKKSLEGVKLRPETLGDYVKHDELFKAYPELKNLKVTIRSDMPTEDHGSYNSQKKEIELNSFWVKFEDAFTYTLIHEIQHAIQDIEGFSGGTSPEYWARVPDGMKPGTYEYMIKKRSEIRDKIFEVGSPEFIQVFREYARGDIEYKDAERVATKEESELLWDYDMADRDAIYVKWHPRTNYDLYDSSAGEVEARDVSKRLGYDAEKRKNTRPDIDRTDVVFSDANVSFSSQDVERYTEKEYNKRKKKGSYYNEQETQFNIWQKSASTPVGAMKAFTRFDKKIHFYQKTEDGCIEIAEWEFNERKYSEYVEDLERAKTRVNVLSPSNGNGGRRNSKYDSVYRYAGTDTGNDFGSEGEGLQNEQSGNLERGRGDSEETSEIKLSLQETAQAGEVKEKLIQENDNLRVANTLLKKEMKLTRGRMLALDNTRLIARQLTEQYSSDYDRELLARQIYNIFNHYDETGDYDYLMNYLATIGKRVVARSSAVDSSLYEDYEDCRKWIRNMEFTLPEQVLKQLNENYDGQFVKKTFGRMRYVSRATHPDAPFLSQIYSELANEYPNFFSIEDNEYEQPMRLIEFWEKIQPTVYNPVNEMGYATEDDASVGFAFDVFNAYSKTDKLETFADKKKKEIENIRKEYDRNLERAKQKLNEDRDRRLEWQKEYYINAREKSSEGRKKAYVKKKIRNVIKDLDKYLNRGSKDKNVKDDLQETVQTALTTAELLFSDIPSNEDIIRAGVTSFTKKEAQWLDEYDILLKKRDDYSRAYALLQEKELTEDVMRQRENLNSLIDNANKRLRYLDKCLEDVFEREKRRLENSTVGEALSKLAVTYAKIKDSEHSYISQSYDENVYDKINELVSGNNGSAKISLLTLNELDSIYEVYKMVLHTVRNANKIFTGEKKQTAEELGKIAMRQIREVGGNKKRRIQALDFLKRFGWSELKPVYAFRLMGSDVLQERYAAMRNGEDTYYRDVSHAKEFYAKLRDKYKTDEWKLDKGYEFVSKDGDKFTLTLEQIMSIYAYCRRGDQAVTHLTRGGFVFSDAITVEEKKKGQIIKYKVDDGTAYSLSPEVLGEINHVLDDNKRAFVEEMQTYLSDVMGDKGNEVSMKMYGVKLFKEKNYFPLKSSAFYRAFDGKVEGESSLKNAGFSKATTPKANNPIVLDDFLSVWSNHVQDMAMYHSFVLPIEDFTKVFNYESHGAEDSRSVSVKATLQGAYGPSAEQYVRNLLTDLNSGVRSQNGTEFVNKLTGLAKKGAVFASMSVVIQQPSAVVRATAHVNPKYFINAFPQSANWLKVSKEYEELKKYAPVAGIKEMGYFDTGLGKSTADWITEKEYRGFGKKFKAFVSKDGKYRDDVFSMLAGKADEVSWVYIWNAVKKEVAEKQHLSGEALLNAAGKRFTEVVELTQVYDSVFSRSGLMRSKDTGVKMVTAFMAEPTTQVNMLFDAAISGKRGNKKQAAAVIGSVYASILVNAILKSIVSSARDDDDEFSYSEKYISNIISSFISDGSIVSSIPFARDIISLVQGYDVERMDMTVIADVVNAFKALKSDKKTTFEKISDIATSLLVFRGVPAKNIFKDIKMLYNTYQNIANGYEFSPGALGESIKREITGKSTPKADLLYNAIVSGDTEYAERLKAMYETESGYNTAIREGLKKYDSRIYDAAVARMEGNTAEYMRLAKEIIAEGNFSQDNIVTAIKSVINSLETDEEPETEDEEKKKSIFEDSDYFDAIIGGDGKTADIVGKDLVDTDVANGKTQEDAEKSLVSSLRNNIRDAFDAGEIEYSEAKNILVKYCGMSETEADNKLKYWDFRTEYPDYDLAEETVIKYYKEIESGGISVDIYYEYYVNQKACKGIKDDNGKTISGSKKEQILKVIDALPLTSKQKDLLYFQNNWSESTLYQAPWH